MFMFVTSFAYSCRSSCSMGENGGGGEVWLWDVESERDEVIVGEDNEADDAVVESRDEI